MTKILALITTVFFLSSCASSNNEIKAEIGECSSVQKMMVSDHITGQNRALEKSDFKKAYTFAAKSFQESFTLDQFESVITGEYQMLLSNNGYSFTECLAEEDYFVQSVSVETNAGVIDLTYRLTLVDKSLGVVAVTVKPSSLDLNT